MIRLAFKNSCHKRGFFSHVLWKSPCSCKSRKSILSKVVVRILLIKNKFKLQHHHHHHHHQRKSFKIAFSLHCRSPSLRIQLRLISENAKELYKNIFTFRNPCFDRNLEACWIVGILVKESQCNQVMNEANIQRF